MCTSKILTDLYFTKQKIKTKNGFVEAVYSVLVMKMCWWGIKKIVWAQSVKVEKETIEFENYFKQIPVPFKIYTGFECNLESAEVYEGSYTKKISRSCSL